MHMFLELACAKKNFCWSYDKLTGEGVGDMLE